MLFNYFFLMILSSSSSEMCMIVELVVLELLK